MRLKLTFIVLLALVVRVIFLGLIPPGVANDELNIAINAQSLLNSGDNIPGVVTGIVGKISGDLSFGIHSEVSSIAIIPFIAILGFNPIAIKIPFVLASLGIVILGYLITKKLINNTVAIVSAVFLSFNPWLIFFGRSAYESILSSFFYFLAIFLILNLQKWKKLYAVLPLILGFCCYFSAKTLIFPISLATSYASFVIDRNKNIKYLIYLNILVIVFVLGYSLILPKTPAGARIKELKVETNLSQTVNTKRTASINTVLTLPFENKFIENFRIRVMAALGEMNSNYLFVNGQPEVIPSLSIPDHGFMYLIDLPLIILGILFLAKYHQKQLITMFAVLSVTFVPNFLNLQGTTYSIRTVILFPFLAILSAIGVYSLTNKYIKTLVWIIYTVSILNFCYIYFARLPIERSEAWFFSERVLAKYIFETSKINPNKTVLVIVTDPKLTFYKYLFYSFSYTNPEEVAILNKKLAQKDYQIDRIKITNDCSEIQKTNSTIIVNSKTVCPKQKEKFIKSINDSGDVYTISGDTLCNNVTLNHYPLIKDVQTLNIEKLTVEDFCKNYISF